LTTAHLVGPPGGRPRGKPGAPGGSLAGRPWGGVAAVDGHEGAALGLVLTGGYRPRPAIIDAIRRADLFATLVADDTYKVASEVHDLLVKTHAADREKIELIKALVAEHLDIDRILDAATDR
jgi:BioD-like phosphotransacetylase family protein